MTEPAKEAGIEAGDVILSIDEIPVASPEELAVLLFTIPDGDEVTVLVRRGEEQKEIAVKLGKIKRYRQGRPYL